MASNFEHKLVIRSDIFSLFKRCAFSHEFHSSPIKPLTALSILEYIVDNDFLVWHSEKKYFNYHRTILFLYEYRENNIAKKILKYFKLNFSEYLSEVHDGWASYIDDKNKLMNNINNYFNEIIDSFKINDVKVNKILEIKKISINYLKKYVRSCNDIEIDVNLILKILFEGAHFKHIQFVSNNFKNNFININCDNFTTFVNNYDKSVIFNLVKILKISVECMFISCIKEKLFDVCKYIMKHFKKNITFPTDFAGLIDYKDYRLVKFEWLDNRIDMGTINFIINNFINDDNKFDYYEGLLLKILTIDNLNVDVLKYIINGCKTHLTDKQIFKIFDSIIRTNKYGFCTSAFKYFVRKYNKEIQKISFQNADNHRTIEFIFNNYCCGLDTGFLEVCVINFKKQLQDMTINIENNGTMYEMSINSCFIKYCSHNDVEHVNKFIKFFNLDVDHDIWKKCLLMAVLYKNLELAMYIIDKIDIKNDKYYIKKLIDSAIDNILVEDISYVTPIDTIKYILNYLDKMYNLKTFKGILKDFKINNTDYGVFLYLIDRFKQNNIYLDVDYNSILDFLINCGDSNINYNAFIKEFIKDEKNNIYLSKGNYELLVDMCCSDNISLLKYLIEEFKVDMARVPIDEMFEECCVCSSFDIMEYLLENYIEQIQKEELYKYFVQACDEIVLISDNYHSFGKLCELFNKYFFDYYCHIEDDWFIVTKNIYELNKCIKYRDINIYCDNDRYINNIKCIVDKIFKR